MQVFGPDGSLWVDTNSFLGRIYGQTTLGPGPDSENLTVLAGQGTPFCICTDPTVLSITVGTNNFVAPIIGSLSFSGTTLSVAYNVASYANPYMTVYYGAL